MQTLYTVENDAKRLPNKLAEMLNALKVADDFEPAKSEELGEHLTNEKYEHYGEIFNNYDICCSRTGRPLLLESDLEFTLYRNMFHRTIRTIGEEKAVFAMQQFFLNQIHPMWLFTDDKALDELQVNEPLSYACYSIIKILETYSTDKWEFHKAKARLYNNLSKLPTPLLHRACEQMRRYLMLVKSSHALRRISWTTTNLTELSKSEQSFRLFIFETTENLCNVISYEFKQGTIKKELTGHDLIKVKDIYIGNTAQRLQKKIQGETESDIIDALVSGLIDEGLIDVPELSLEEEELFKDIDFKTLSPTEKKSTRELYLDVKDNKQKQIAQEAKNHEKLQNGHVVQTEVKEGFVFTGLKIGSKE